MVCLECGRLSAAAIGFTDGAANTCGQSESHECATKIGCACKELLASRMGAPAPMRRQRDRAVANNGLTIGDLQTVSEPVFPVDLRADRRPARAHACG